MFSYRSLLWMKLWKLAPCTRMPVLPRSNTSLYDTVLSVALSSNRIPGPFHFLKIV